RLPRGRIGAGCRVANRRVLHWRIRRGVVTSQVSPSPAVPSGAGGANDPRSRGEPMELVSKKRLYLVSGRNNIPLAEEIARKLGVELGDAQNASFANGELHCQFSESVRGMDVFIVQSHATTAVQTINDSLMEQLIMVDAAQRASARRVTVVTPCYAYSRQDRKSEGREPI